MPRTKKKVKSIVKTKVISARVTEVVHELLHRQAEDAGMTLSEFTAQMLMKGRVNTSYVFYVHPDEIEAITREFAAIGNNLNQIAAFFNSGGIQSRAMHENINHAGKVPSPATRKLQSGAKLSLHFRKSDEPPWSAKAVDRILHNEVYIGKLVQGKTRRLDFRSKKKIQTDKS